MYTNNQIITCKIQYLSCEKNDDIPLKKKHNKHNIIFIAYNNYNIIKNINDKYKN